MTCKRCTNAAERRMNVTEQELRKQDKVTPELASKYLKGTAAVSPQAIRCWAVAGECPFCHALKMGEKAHRYVYIVNIEALIRYKRGEYIMGEAPKP